MIWPRTPANEAARVAALRAYDVLDSEQEAPFDDLTKLAASVMNVPIALISLIDADRQWFKSRYGLDLAEPPREVSFCAHLVADENALVVRDALTDERFADNPLVTGEPRVRFYAGVPLRTPDGFVLGSLCAIDHTPREPTPTQLEMLSLLARQVVDQLEARREHRLLAVERAAALESSRRLGALFEAMVEGVVLHGRDGVIHTSNSAAARILGLTGEQLGGRGSMDARWKAIHEDGSPFPGETHPSMVTARTGKPSVGVVMGVHTPDGELTWIRISALPLSGDDVSPGEVLTTFHDITALKAAHDATERLSRQEHLVTMGTLAGGIGHEINNPLACILANLELSLEALLRVEGGSPPGRLREVVEVLGEAREAAEQIRKIVKGLKVFTREGSAPVPTSVHEIVETAINLAAHEIRHKATIQSALASTPPVLADEARLGQVMVNLLMNAAQAFSTSDIDRNRITVTSAVAPDGRVLITVSDNGPGIPTALQRRIFDPFFTTKPVGQGTGLGLSISQSLVRGLGGELVVESTPPDGASFRIFLPAATAPPLASPAAEVVPSSARGRVLVIDDEPAILKSIRRALERDHDVVTLGDPREALTLLASDRHFDVILCDLMMPHLSGDMLHAQVRERDPAVAERFIFITGGAAQGHIQSFVAEVPNERIEKPFNLENLREIVRSHVNARAASS